MMTHPPTVDTPDAGTRVSDALARHWTRDPVKVGALARDTWFLEAAEQLMDVCDDAAGVGADGGAVTDAARIGAGTATLLVKPDGIATGSARTVVDWTDRSGFVIHDAVALQMDHNGIRALWYHQWNIASAERRLLADLLCELSPALLLVVGRRSGGAAPDDTPRPCAVQLTELKGPTSPRLRRPGHLRGRLPGGSYLLNQVHTADEPADVLRELGVYLHHRRRRACLDRVVAGHDASAQARQIADELDSAYGGYSTDVEPAREALQASRIHGESDADLCLRLLRSPEPVPSELAWPVLVTGAACLPMRTPGGSPMLANPPAAAWDEPRRARQGRGIVDRDLVHRRAVAETFATAIGPALLDDDGRRVIETAVQLARMHPVHSDHLGAQHGRADLLHLMEAIRQVCVGAGQAVFGAKRSDVFVVRGFRAAFVDLPPAVGGLPIELFPRLTVAREHRLSAGDPVTGVDVDIDVVDADGRTAARSWGSYSWISARDFAHLREGMRDTLGLSGAPAAGPAAEAIAPEDVLRRDPRNSVLSADETGRQLLVVDTSHPVHFDHPLDHVPGMLQLEGARQAALLTLDPVDRARVCVTGVESRFVAFAELELPVTCRAVPGRTERVDAGGMGIVVELVQSDRVVSEVTVVVEAASTNPTTPGVERSDEGASR